MAKVMTGIDMMVEEGFAPLKGRRLGLLAQFLSVRNLRQRLGHDAPVPT